MVGAGIILFFGAEFFVSQFTDNAEAIKHGAIYLKVAAFIGPIYPIFFITTAVFQALKKPIYSLYLSILRLTAFPFLSLWYVINIRGGDYNDIFYTIMATNWVMGIALIIFIGYFLNDVFKQKKIILVISISVLVFLFTYTDIKSQDVKITDGDTIKINGEKIRFSGIDTPELNQTCVKEGVKNSCGLTAKQILIDKIIDNKVKCIKEGKDRYKRILAECFVNNESLSRYLVRSGYAFAYRKYSKKFIIDEDYARANKLGMWSMEFEYPWDFRRSN
jgi:endonuclease YncB( thermonuclease family)